MTTPTGGGNRHGDRYRRIGHDPAAVEDLFVDFFLDAHERPPARITLDLDATDDPIHGRQEGWFFHGYYDCYCYLPRLTFCGDHLLAADHGVGPLGVKIVDPALDCNAAPNISNWLANAREAMIWIEGLDHINKLAGGSRRRGINLCVDLGNALLHPGLRQRGRQAVSLDRLRFRPAGRDRVRAGEDPTASRARVSGAGEAAYFNIWRWTQAKAKEDGLGTNITPEIVMNYASAPINLLAQE